MARRPDAVSAYMQRVGFAHPVVDDVGFINPMMLRRIFRRRGGGMDDDDLGYMDGDDDLGFMDEEIEGMLADDEEVVGFDGEEDLGATGSRLASKIQRIQAKIAELETKARHSRPRRARNLMRRVSRLRAGLARKQQRLSNKLNRAVRRGRLSPGAAAAMAAAAGATTGGGLAAGMMTGGQQTPPGGAMSGYQPSAWANVPFTGASIPELLNNEVERSPAAGEEIRIPLLVGGSSVVNVNIPAGAGLRTIAITAQTPVIPYAGFQIVGLDVEVRLARGENASGFPNQDILPNVLVTSYNVSGDKNLLYAAQSVGFAGQGRGIGGDPRRTISGLRENQIIQPTNTVDLNATFRQEITTAVEYNATVSFAAVCRTIYDPSARIGPGRR